MEERVSNEEINENMTLENDEILKKNPHYKNLVLAENLLKFFNKRRLSLQVEMDDHNFHEYGFEHPLSMLQDIVSSLAVNDKILKKISSSWLNIQLKNVGQKIVELPNVLDASFKLAINELVNSLAVIIDYMVAFDDLVRALEIADESFSKFGQLKKNISESHILLDDLRNKTIKEIYDEDYKKFSKISRNYEIGFYSLIFIMFLYFLGFNLSI